MLLLGGVAVGDTTNDEAARWLSTGAHRTRMLVGICVTSGGALAFVVFAAGLLQRLRSAHAPTLARDVAQLAAISFVVLTLAAAVGMASAAYAVASHVEAEPVDPAAVRVSTFGFALWAIPAALAGATFIASVSAAALACGALPRWLALIGFLLAALGVFGIMFLPTLGIFIWAVLVAIVTFVRHEAPSPTRAEPSPA
jgi:hypothetical protein